MDVWIEAYRLLSKDEVDACFEVMVYARSGFGGEGIRRDIASQSPFTWRWSLARWHV